MNRNVVIGCIIAFVVFIVLVCLCLFVLPILLGPQIGNVFSRVTSGLK